MEHVSTNTRAWNLLFDPAAANAIIEHVSRLELPRRVCRPLDRRRGRIENSDLARFDAAVEATAEADAEYDQTTQKI